MRTGGSPGKDSRWNFYCRKTADCGFRLAAAYPTKTLARRELGNGRWRSPEESLGKRLSSPWSRAPGRRSERGSNDDGAELNPARRGRKEVPSRGSRIRNGKHTRPSRHVSSCEPYPSQSLRKRRGEVTGGSENSRGTYSSDFRNGKGLFLRGVWNGLHVECVLQRATLKRYPAGVAFWKTPPRHVAVSLR